VRWDDKGAIKDISKASEGKAHITGIQAQLWTETIRSFDHVTYYIFPKMTGLFERAWNATPAWAETTVADDPAFQEGLDKFYSTSVEKTYTDTADNFAGDKLDSNTHKTYCNGSKEGFLVSDFRKKII